MPVPRCVHWRDYVSHCPGGRGAVREVIELILGVQGRWQSVVASYCDNRM